MRHKGVTITECIRRQFDCAVVSTQILLSLHKPRLAQALIFTWYERELDGVEERIIS